MPIAFILIGVLFLTAAVRGTLFTANNQEGLLPLLEGDFAGPNNFLLWIVAIWVIGALGYIPGFKPISNAFLTLVLIVIFLSNKGFFSQFQSAINQTQSSAQATATVQQGGAAMASSSVPSVTASMASISLEASALAGLF
jgi:hypothetical protein